MVILYSTGCPMCNALKRQLEKKGISFETVTDEKVMHEKGLTAAPALEIEGKILDFTDAMSWVRGQ